MKIYKEGQGSITRYCSVVLAVIVALYAAFCWYSWSLTWSGADVSMRSDAGLYSFWGIAGAVVLLAGIIGCGIWLSFVKEVSCEFLIDVDAELRKVVWPEMLPLFDPKASAWGSTYVVIVTTIILTIYIGVVDLIFGWTLSSHLFKWLLSRAEPL